MKICYNIKSFIQINLYGGLIMKKTIWRSLWIVAVALGGVSLVKVALEILNLDSKKYIDV